MKENSSAVSKRPLSPHLQIYKPQITSVMSILHRATGVYIYLGVLLLAWTFFCISIDPSTDCVGRFARSIIGQLMILGWAAAIYYHLFNGVRHLRWDMGKGFELKEVYRSGYTVLIATALATAYTIYKFYFGVNI
jgi:succinate dehydrogenase / fumarate reductase, cytochrome b subunit